MLDLQSFFNALLCRQKARSSATVGDRQGFNSGESTARPISSPTICLRRLRSDKPHCGGCRQNAANLKRFNCRLPRRFTFVTTRHNQSSGSLVHLNRIANWRASDRPVVDCQPVRQWGSLEQLPNRLHQHVFNLGRHARDRACFVASLRIRVRQTNVTRSVIAIGCHQNRCTRPQLLGL